MGWNLLRMDVESLENAMRRNRLNTVQYDVGGFGILGHRVVELARHCPLSLLPGISMPRVLASSPTVVTCIYMRQKLACSLIALVIVSHLLIALISD